MTDRFWFKVGYVHELWDGHYSWVFTNNECNKLQRDSLVIMYWDYNKFINRGGNGDSDTAGIDGQSYMTLMEIAG